MSDFVQMIVNNPELAAKTIQRLSTEVDELEAENEKLRKHPKPLLFGTLIGYGFRVIISEQVPQNEIWFASQDQLKEALIYSEEQVKQALKGGEEDVRGTLISRTD